jgi:hypothetical protein
VEQIAMITRAELEEWILESIRRRGGEASVIEVAKDLWHEHEDDLRGSGDLFYRWQYDMRWVADGLRKAGRLKLSGRKWALA